MNGVLVVDKPPGPTSHDVVARVRRAIGLRRIGHTGTLDPLATGVLPLVVGRATRLASLLSAAVKAYQADVRLGASTPTYDAEPRAVVDRGTGRVAALLPPPAAPSGLGPEAIEKALLEFRGTHWQVPPPFSAKKAGGVRSYKRARRQEAVTPRPVSVTVSSLVLASYADGLARLEVTCSPGFYVRSLAHDLGERLGCGAHLEALRRTRAGEFSLPQAVPLDVVESEGTAAIARLIPMERLLMDLPSAVLTDRGAIRASHGNAVGPEDFEPGGLPDEAGSSQDAAEPPGCWRLLDGSGALLGIAQPLANGLLHPVIVLV